MRRKAGGGGGGDLGGGRHAKKEEGRKEGRKIPWLSSFPRTYPVLVILNSPVTKPATPFRRLKTIFSL